MVVLSHPLRMAKRRFGLSGTELHTWILPPAGPEPPESRSESARVRVDEFIFERKNGFITAWVALATAPAKELSVDSARFMKLRSDDVQSAALDHFRRGTDVRSSSGHVGRHRHTAGRTGLLDLFGLVLVLSCAQHAVRKAAGREPTADLLRGLDRSRADKNRTSLVMKAPSTFDDGVPFLLDREKDSRR